VGGAPAPAAGLGGAAELLRLLGAAAGQEDADAEGGQEGAGETQRQQDPRQREQRGAEQQQPGEQPTEQGRASALPELSDLAGLQELLSHLLARHSAGDGGEGGGGGGGAAVAGLGSMTADAVLEELEVMMAT
jgi:hypothetical protein